MKINYIICEVIILVGYVNVLVREYDIRVY